MNYTPKEIIYNSPHPTILLRIEDAPTRELLILLTQEAKRDLVYRRMNIKENHHNRPTPLIRVQAHILSIVEKIKQEYLSLCDDFKNEMKFDPKIFIVLKINCFRVTYL